MWRRLHLRDSFARSLEQQLFDLDRSLTPPGMNLLREAPLGQILNWASGGRLLPYPEQRPGFVAPARYLVDDAERQGNINSGTPTLVEQEAVSRRELGGDLEKGAASDLETPRQNTYPYLVEWEESDSDNPL